MLNDMAVNIAQGLNDFETHMTVATTALVSVKP